MGTESYMKLENYFDFVEEDVIRIKGNRIGIEIVLEDHLEGASPEEILLRYQILNLEKIHDTILYYSAKKEKVAEYLERVRRLDEEASQEQLRNPSLVSVFGGRSKKSLLGRIILP